MKENFEAQINFRTVVETALRRAHEKHESLGVKGEERISKNQFGETALRLDLEAEEVILETLKEARIPVRVISEEHGIVNITGSPLYLGILDGLDGSNRYEAGRGKERYGTMFAVFSNLNPAFDEYVVSGIMEHSTNKLFIAEKGKGCHTISTEGEKQTRVAISSSLAKKTRIYIDEHWELNRKTFSEKLANEFTIKDLRSFAAYFADLISGEVDLVLACTRKGNLEPAIGYGLVSESGEVMVSIDGSSLQDKKYLEFGQIEQTPIISATSQSLALKLIEYLSYK